MLPSATPYTAKFRVGLRAHDWKKSGLITFPPYSKAVVLSQSLVTYRCGGSVGISPTSHYPKQGDNIGGGGVVVNKLTCWKRHSSLRLGTNNK